MLGRLTTTSLPYVKRLIVEKQDMSSRVLGPMVRLRAASETKQMRILRISKGEKSPIDDTVVLERPATIFLNDAELVTLMCSPTHLEELAVGFLFSEGVIEGKQDLQSVVADEDEGVVWVATKGRKKSVRDLLSRRLITTGCGRGLSFHDASSNVGLKVRSKLTVPPEDLIALMSEFQRMSELYRLTGGVHSAAVCDSKGVLELSEDIGRHSAVDKVLGRCILGGVSTADRILITSGRISSEMLVKAARANIPIIVSKSAPTDLGVSLAKSFGITLAGFVRGSRMNIYSNPKRIS